MHFSHELHSHSGIMTGFKIQKNKIFFEGNFLSPLDNSVVSYYKTINLHQGSLCITAGGFNEAGKNPEFVSLIEAYAGKLDILKSNPISHFSSRRLLTETRDAKIYDEGNFLVKEFFTPTPIDFLNRLLYIETICKLLTQDNPKKNVRTVCAYALFMPNQQLKINKKGFLFMENLSNNTRAEEAIYDQQLTTIWKQYASVKSAVFELARKFSTESIAKFNGHIPDLNPKNILLIGELSKPEDLEFVIIDP